MEESAKRRKRATRGATGRTNSKRGTADEDRSEEARRALADMLGLHQSADWNEIHARQQAHEAQFGLTGDADITLSFLDDDNG